MTRGVLAVSLPYQVEVFHQGRPLLRSSTNLSRRTEYLVNSFNSLPFVNLLPYRHLTIFCFF
jgi:hypothetical protein